MTFLPPLETLKAMSREQYAAFWKKSEAEMRKHNSNSKQQFSPGDEVRIVFDSLPGLLGDEGVIVEVDGNDTAFPFKVEIDAGTAWVSMVEPLHPDITVPELNTMEEADRFLDSITKER